MPEYMRVHADNGRESVGVLSRDSSLEHAKQLDIAPSCSFESSVRTLSDGTTTEKEDFPSVVSPDTASGDSMWLNTTQGDSDSIVEDETIEAEGGTSCRPENDLQFVVLQADDHKRMGRYNQALEFYRHALHMCKSSGVNRVTILIEILNSVAAIQLQTGGTTAAIQAFHYCVELCQCFSQDLQCARALHQLAEAYLYGGDPQTALEAANEALAMLLAVKDASEDLISVWSLLAQIHECLGQKMEAETCRQEVRAVRKQQCALPVKEVYTCSNVNSAHSHVQELLGSSTKG